MKEGEQCVEYRRLVGDFGGKMSNKPPLASKKPMKPFKGLFYFKRRKCVYTIVKYDHGND